MNAYYREWDDWSYTLKKLNPTGRWKETRNENESVSMYVEHKGFIFKHWIHESNVVFKDFEVGEKIFNCKGV